MNTQKKEISAGVVKLLVATSPNTNKNIYLSLESPTVKILGAVKSGLEIISSCKTLRSLPDILLIETGVTDFDCIQTINFLLYFYPSVKVILVGSPGSTINEHRLDIIGAHCQVMKSKETGFGDSSFKELLSNAIAETFNSGSEIGIPCATKVNSMTRDQLRVIKDNHRQILGLTIIEYELLLLSTSGATYPELGRLLNKSPRTIETQVRQLNHKLNLKTGLLSLALFSIREEISVLHKQHLLQ